MTLACSTFKSNWNTDPTWITCLESIAKEIKIDEKQCWQLAGIDIERDLSNRKLSLSNIDGMWFWKNAIVNITMETATAISYIRVDFKNCQYVHLVLRNFDEKTSFAVLPHLLTCSLSSRPLWWINSIVVSLMIVDEGRFIMLCLEWSWRKMRSLAFASWKHFKRTTLSFLLYFQDLIVKPIRVCAEMRKGGWGSDCECSVIN